MLQIAELAFAAWDVSDFHADSDDRDSPPLVPAMTTTVLQFQHANRAFIGLESATAAIRDDDDDDDTPTTHRDINKAR